MADSVIRLEFDATLDDFLDVHMRQIRRWKASQGRRPHSMIFFGVTCGLLVAGVLDGLLGRPLGNDLVIAGVLGGFAGSVSGPMYDRNVASRTRRMLLQHYGGRLPMRIEIELRPTCLWIRQDGVELALDWTTARSVEETADGVGLWFHWGLVVARNRGFATSSDRARFVEQARAFIPDGPHAADVPSA
jgi:hypothetical protein